VQGSDDALLAVTLYVPSAREAGESLDREASPYDRTPPDES